MRDDRPLQAVAPTASQHPSTGKTGVPVRCQQKGSTKTLFAVHEGKIFVQIRATGIPTLFIYIDGVRIRRFPKDRHLYVTLDDAILWLEKELALAKRKQPLLKALAVLRDAREHFEAELRAEAARAGRAKAWGGMEVA